MSNAPYLVTARKYRPQTFGEVVAQEHVTETLKNALRLDRLAHAYLFTGPRGVGKTTAARILAKAINCTTPPNERGDLSEPCRTCDSCRSFEQGRNMNIIEIDAASNNKVDDVRDLRETVRVPPQGNRMKVYIIDEVHMLSNAAFNALLKTLEEPPPHALFIFATTEPHKVLPTIQSRCQRFDFRRIAVDEIVERLKEICTDESLDVDDASLVLIARKGDGALRDALSVFDQAVSLCGTTVTHQALTLALGVVDDDLYFQSMQAVSDRDAAGMIRLVAEVVHAGYDLQEFVDGLAEHIRNVLVARTVGDVSLIEATDVTRERFAAQARDFSESTLMGLVHIIGQTADALRNSRQPRLALEMALLRMASLPDAVDMRRALASLDRIEKAAAAGNVTFSVAAKESRTSSPEPAAQPAPQPAREPAPKPAPKPAPEPPRSYPEPSRQAPEPKATPAPALDSPRRSSSETETSMFQPAPAIKRRRPPEEPSAAVQSSDDVDVLELEPEATDALTTLVKAWTRVVAEVLGTEKQLGSIMSHTKVTAFHDRTITLAVPDDFHARTLLQDKARLAHRLTEEADIHVDTISFDVRPTTSDEHVTVDPEQDARQFLDQKCEENPAVRALVERFGGEIVW